MTTVSELQPPSSVEPLRNSVLLPRSAWWLVCLLFFLSGGAALVYEISWSRQIGLLFGHTIHAAAVVLAGYFAGLAAGYALGARLVSRVHPLRAYAVAEILAAGWACLIPLVLSLAETDTGAALLQHASPDWQLLVRGAFSLVVLLPATVALGSTLPFMSGFLEQATGTPHDQRDAPHNRVVRAYAWNTAGAFTGVAVATGFLLILAGVRGSSLVAAGVSALCAAGAWWLAGRLPAAALAEADEVTVAVPAAKSPPDTAPATPPASRFSPALALLLAGLSGFGTLALQVLHARMFSLVFHNSTYTFGIVVAVFLLSLALGAWLAAFLSRWFSPALVIATGCWLGSLLTATAPVLFVMLTRLQYFSRGDSFETYLLAATGLVAVVVLPAVTSLGMVLPSLWSATDRHASRLAVLVGRSTMVNTVAAALGSILASFVLLPWLGLWNAFALLASLNGAVALAVLIHQRRPAMALMAWLTLLPALLVLISGHGPERWAELPRSEKLLRRWDSAYGWIDVVQVGPRQVLKVRQNLHYRFGATGSNAPREFRQAQLPLLLHPAPRNIAFLGLGTGMTAGGAVPDGNLVSIEIAELIPEVVDAARMLGEFNLNVVDDPRTTMHVDDARHFLLATDHRFDVIVSDLFVPWESETGYLYTVEQYRLCRRKLQPGGVFCQWLALYQLGPGDFELIADSMATVFPHTTLWWGEMHSRRPIVALVGTEEPLRLNATELSHRLQQLETGMASQGGPSIGTPQQLLDLLAGRWTVRFPQRLNTDEFPRVEFHSPLSHRDRRLLQRDTLQAYYDAVLHRLPPAAVHHESGSGLLKLNDDHQLRRNRQRFVLFGE